jgi:hypothetical protein
MDALKTGIASEASAPKGKQPRKARPMTARMTMWNDDALKKAAGSVPTAASKSREETPKEGPIQASGHPNTT